MSQEKITWSLVFIIASFSLLQKGSQSEPPLYTEVPKTRSALVLKRVPDSDVLRSP